MREHRSRIRNLLLLFGVGMIWGSQFIAQDAAISAVAPVWVGVGRTVIGFLTLLVICTALSLRSRKSNLKLYAVIGLLEATIPFALIPWGQQFLASSIAAILMGTVPFFAIIFAPLLINGARLTVSGLLSVVAGFVGLVVLFLPDFFNGRVAVNPQGALAILFAAASFAVALLLLNRVADEHPLIVARNVLGMASLQILLIAVIVSPLEIDSMGLPVLGALVYLGVMCAGVVYVLYMTLIRDAGAVFASMTNYLVPAIGVVIGAVLNAEPLSMSTAIALFVILSAIALNQWMDSRGARSNELNAPAD